MSASPARFTAHGTFVSIPMEMAAQTFGAAVFASPALAWDALRLRREKARTRKTLPPIMGGSPYADRGTGWHAEGCLCRACNA